MNRQEFMKQLEYLLRNIPESERNDALAYYHNYFDEAGVDNEQDVLRELGTPKQVAQTILADYDGYGMERDYGAPEMEYKPIVYGEKQHDNYQKDKYFGSRNSYEDVSNQQNTTEYQNNTNYGKTRYQNQGNSQNNEYSKSGNNTYQKHSVQPVKKKMNTSTIILIVIIAILTFPIWIGIVAGLFGTVVGVLGAAFGVVAGLGGAGIGMAAGSIACIGVGIFKIFSIPAEGFALIGVGAIFLSLSILLILLVAWIVFRWIPALVKPFIYWMKSLFQSQKGDSRA